MTSLHRIPPLLLVLVSLIAAWTSWPWSRAAHASTDSNTAPSSGYALVVTNNASLDLSRPNLNYADDDAAKYARLFEDALGRGHVTVLTEFDPDTRVLFPKWGARAEPPTRANVFEKVRSLAARARGAIGSGGEMHVYLVFAGHGDIDGGQGYIELADGRLTATELEEHVIEPLADVNVHLIIDSCNSYFMINPRKPGGQRWSVDSKPAASLLDRYPRVGAIISTSAENETFEWSTLQAGIFSHEVRS